MQELLAEKGVDELVANDTTVPETELAIRNSIDLAIDASYVGI
jgi:hypothetical protein